MLRLILKFAFILLMSLQPVTHAWAQNGSPATNYTGSVDHSGCDNITGWAADRTRLNYPINVGIYDWGFLVVTVPATAFRPDVKSFLGDNGLHGFTVPTPQSFKDGFPHNVSVRFESSTTELGGSPQPLTCFGPPPPLTAEHYIVSGPTGGSITTVINHFYRDGQGRTRYDDGTLATIMDPVAQQTIVLDLLRRTSSHVSWTTANPGNNPAALPTPAIQQNLISSPFDPGPFNFIFPDSTIALPLALADTAPCPAVGKGYSVAGDGPPPTQGGLTLIVPTVVKVWTCGTMSLPMYVIVQTPANTTVEGFRIMTQGEPDSQLFVQPPGFTEDNLLSGTVAPSGSPCAVRRTSAPLLLLSNGNRLGQNTYTALTSGISGCTVANVSIQAGPSISARFLTLRGVPAFHILFSDNGGSNPTAPGADIGLVLLTLSDGFTSVTTSDFVILTKF